MHLDVDTPPRVKVWMLEEGASVPVNMDIVVCEQEQMSVCARVGGRGCVGVWVGGCARNMVYHTSGFPRHLCYLLQWERYTYAYINLAKLVVECNYCQRKQTNITHNLCSSGVK